MVLCGWLPGAFLNRKPLDFHFLLVRIATFPTPSIHPRWSWCAYGWLAGVGVVAKIRSPFIYFSYFVPLVIFQELFLCVPYDVMW